METQGCEIEAIGISYNIYTQKRGHPFKIFNKEQQQKKKRVEEDQELEEQPPTEIISTPCPGFRQVLKDVNCRAKPWEILAIVGPSGAGKSSLLEILAGKLRPESASIFVNQKPINKARFKKISGYVTQKDTLFPLLTVEETLMFSAKLRLRLPESELSSRVESLIQELGLSHVAGARVGNDRV
uniref:ABC transporter domain-containing protein n=1 Tax=Davidia involucrata TaxID=16924 RepID=A0A5B7BQW8_DAVIN